MRANQKFNSSYIHAVEQTFTQQTMNYESFIQDVNVAENTLLNM